MSFIFVLIPNLTILPLSLTVDINRLGYRSVPERAIMHVSLKKQRTRQQSICFLMK